MNARLQSKSIVWNDIYRDRAVDHEFVGNAEEGVIVPGDQKRMVRFNYILNRINEGLLCMSIIINVFTHKDKSDEVVICFIMFVKGISTVRKFMQGVGYDWMIVEEISHRRYGG